MGPVNSAAVDRPLPPTFLTFVDLITYTKTCYPFMPVIENIADRTSGLLDRQLGQPLRCITERTAWTTPLCWGGNVGAK